MASTKEDISTWIRDDFIRLLTPCLRETDGKRLVPLCCVNELSESRIRLQSTAILRTYVQPIEFPRSWRLGCCCLQGGTSDKSQPECVRLVACGWRVEENAAGRGGVGMTLPSLVSVGANSPPISGCSQAQPTVHTIAVISISNDTLHKRINMNNKPPT